MNLIAEIAVGMMVEYFWNMPLGLNLAMCSEVVYKFLRELVRCLTSSLYFFLGLSR